MAKKITNSNGAAAALTCDKITMVKTERNNRLSIIMIGSYGYINSSDNILSGTTVHALLVKEVRYCNGGADSHYLICVDPWNEAMWKLFGLGTPN